MKKADKCNNKNTQSESKFFWRLMEETSAYKLVDAEGNLVRSLPTLDVTEEDLKLFENVPEFKVGKDGKLRFWRSGVLDIEKITAPVWGRRTKSYTGWVFTQETINEAKVYVEEISKRLEKLKKQAEKKNFKKEFDRLFNWLSYDGVSMFWEPESHPEFSDWEKQLESSEYIWYMHKDSGFEMCEEAKGNWGIILKKDYIDAVKSEEYKELHITMPQHVTKKVKDRSFISSLKYALDLGFICIKEVA